MFINLHCDGHVQKPHKTKYDVSIYEKIQEAITETVGDDLTVILFLDMNTLPTNVDKNDFRLSNINSTAVSNVYR